MWLCLRERLSFRPSPSQNKPGPLFYKKKIEILKYVVGTPAVGTSLFFVPNREK